MNKIIIDIVDGVEWVYVVGRQHVVANSEKGERRLIDHMPISGCKYWPDYDVPITPSMVEKWLIKTKI
jgi:hypothetical protein